MSDEPREETRDPGLFQVMKAIVAGAIGVGSRESLERDMRSRSPLPYIIIGIVGTMLFIGTVVTVVRLVLRSAGA